MSDNTVRVYDDATKQIVTIPERELAPGMIPVETVGQPGVVWHDAANLGDSHPPLRQAPLADFRPLFSWFSRLFAACYPRTPEEWEDGFRADANFATEILLWVYTAEVFEHFTAGRNLEPEKQRDILTVVLNCGFAGPDQVPLVTDPRTLSKKRVRAIAACFGEVFDPDVREGLDRYVEWRKKHPGKTPMGELNDELAVIIKRYTSRRVESEG